MAGSSDIDRGRMVGKYEILTRLSVGGMAELYLAFTAGPGGFKKFVALKQILPDVKADDSFVKMFLDEARITAALQHANIGQVFDLGEDPKSHELYLAMEFIAGQNLEQLIKRAAKREAPIPVGFAARVIRDTCLGLHSAHHFMEPSTGKPMPVVHRDVSPKNVMITYTGQVKVIDFGIAKARGRLNKTQVGIVKGTSGYMSPEQVKNEPLDGRTDLFAVAVMLHELLSGERLFTAPSDAAMMIKIVEGDIDEPTKNNPYVSPELSAVVMKGLERNRDTRYASGKELARAIEQACPDLFDDEQVAELMKQLFDDKIELTRSLFEMANEGHADQGKMTAAAQVLTTEEASAGTPRPRKATGAQRVSSNPSQKAGSSVARLSKTGDKPAAKATGTSKSHTPGAGRSVSKLPKVEAKKPAAEEDGESTLPPKKAASQKLAPVQAKAGPGETTAPKSGGLFGKLIAAVLVLGVLGGGGWAVTVGPLKDKLKKVAIEEEPPPDLSAKPLTIEKTDDTSMKPKWLVEREKQKAAEAADAQRTKAAEEAANDPERLKQLAEIQAQIDQLDRLEAEQRQLKIEAKQGKSSTEANSKKIDDLQKQIDELKTALDTKKGGKGKAAATAAKGSDGEVQVVKDRRTAADAALGYFSIRTVNPSATDVYDGDLKLGATPLAKIPLEAGAHKLKVYDADANPRMLSVIIESGKHVEMKGLDVSSLPPMK